jgi:hypothetical protein
LVTSFHQPKDAPTSAVGGAVRRRDSLMPATGAVLLLLVAFLTTGGDLSTAPNQVPTSWVDVLLIAAGGCGAAALVVTRRDGSGTLCFSLFAAVAVLSALSIAWSVAPDQTWEESGRTVAYVAAFGLALTAARHSGADSRGALLAVTLAAVGLCIWALAVKALHLDLYGQRDYGTVQAPFAYQNATGLTGALALPGLIWLASGRRNPPLARGLATAGITVAASVLALSLSRSAIAAAVLATVIPLFGLRARRRAVVMLALGLLGGVPIWLYGLTDHNVYGDSAGSIYGANAGTIHRAGAGLVLGLIVIVMVLVVCAAATAVGTYADRTVQPARRITLFDRGLLGLIAAVPVAIVLWLVFNARGPFGELSHLWKAATSVTGAPVGGTGDRLANLGSSRSAYWRQAFSVGEHNLLGGTGAGTFFPAHLRYSTATITYPGQDAHHAHSYVLDTFASFGLIGVVLNASLLVAWCRDARRAISAPGNPLRTTGATTIGATTIGATTIGATTIGATTIAPGAREIDARWALIGVVIAFGVSSALDYTWYFPGVAVPALLAAGWVAGVSGARRGSAAQLAPAGPDRPAGAPPTAAPVGALGSRPGAIVALTVLAALTLAVAWESLQPMRSTQSTGASLTALVHRHGTPALDDARAAVSEDPLSVAALTQLANVYGAIGDGAAKRAELVKATHTQPDNPQPFVTLGGYLLCDLHDPAAAMSPLRRATMLDVTDSDSQSQLLADARARTRPSALLCDGIA